MPEGRTYKSYSGGEWRAAATGIVFEVHEPFSGQLYAKVAAVERADARSGVAGYRRRVSGLWLLHARAGFAF